MNFTTLEKVQTFLNKGDEVLTQNEIDIINLLITNVNGIIRNYCGWRVLAHDYDLKFDGNGERILDLKVYPLNTVTLVEIDGVDNTVDASLNEEDGEIYFESDTAVTLTSGYRNIRVQFNAGFAVVPDDLEFAATWLVTQYFNRIDLENIGVNSEQFNDIKVEYDSTDLPVLVKHTLDLYRRLGIF